MNTAFAKLDDNDLLNVTGGVGELVEETNPIISAPSPNGAGLGNGLTEENVGTVIQDKVKCYSCKQMVDIFKKNGKKRKTCPLCGGQIYKNKH